MKSEIAEQVVRSLKEANNVLVTVKTGPTLDELSAAIALTLILNHLNKHATTVFSGRVPATLNFLQPETAIETTTDSLRDFIIALDKSKADKLRYKVEDDVVRIFITPYKTSISDKDLEFSQGDFNVDVVVALGVVDKNDFDQVIRSHGRILHDATLISVTKRDVEGDLGAINWHDDHASSLCEMLTGIVEELGDDVLEGQSATALLTGIVDETDRFKNEHTTPQALTMSSKLMAAGANQQLIAEKLEEDAAPHAAATKQSDTPVATTNDDGSLEIMHEDEIAGIHVDDQGNMKVADKKYGESDEDSIDVDDMFAEEDETAGIDEAHDQDELQDQQESSSRGYVAPPIPQPVSGEQTSSDAFYAQHSDSTDPNDSYLRRHKVIQPLDPELPAAPMPEHTTPQGFGPPMNTSVPFGMPPPPLPPKPESPAPAPQPSFDFTPTPQGDLPQSYAPEAQFTPTPVDQPLELSAIPADPAQAQPAAYEEPVAQPVLPPMPQQPVETVLEVAKPEEQVPPAAVEPISTEPKPELTLNELEQAVGSSHAPQPPTAPSIPPLQPPAELQDYMGTAQPQQSTEQPPAPQQTAPPQEEAKQAETVPAPPSVPPPIMPLPPPPSQQPQFYEADGTPINPFSGS